MNIIMYFCAFLKHYLTWYLYKYTIDALSSVLAYMLLNKLH